MKAKTSVKKLVVLALVLALCMGLAAPAFGTAQTERYVIFDYSGIRISLCSEPISREYRGIFYYEGHQSYTRYIFTVNVGTTLFAELTYNTSSEATYLLFIDAIDSRTHYDIAATYNNPGSFIFDAPGRYAAFNYWMNDNFIVVADAPPPPPPAGVTATPTQAPVLVNGQNVAFQAYHIGGNNFFRLRDIAYILNGTSAQFNVEWDAAKSAVLLISGTPYTPVGGEMPGAGIGPVTATPTQAAVLLDGEPVNLRAYHIGGNNFFMLRDLGEILGFGVDWDEAARTILIDTD